MKQRDPALSKAFALVGGQTQLGALLGIRRQAVHKWKRCPAERVIQLERLSGVPRTELRPDLYPAE